MLYQLHFPRQRLFLGLLLLPAWVSAQTLAPSAIVEKAYYNQRGNTNNMRMTMQVVRPTWSRDLSIQTWSQGNDQSVMKITAPAKDKGIGFLKLKTEGWNWLPTIERVVKISPSQMAQSWMGSDFTNEDMLREASIVHDYTHQLAGEETLAGTPCYKIVATPKPDAPVVWGKVLLWVGKGDLLERKAEYYDEDGQLVNTLVMSNVRPLGGKTVATQLEMIPANKEKGRKTVITIQDAKFDLKYAADFFSVQNLKRLQ